MNLCARLRCSAPATHRVKARMADERRIDKSFCFEHAVEEFEALRDRRGAISSSCDALPVGRRAA